MNRILGTYEHGRVVVDTPAEWPDGSRVEVTLMTPGSESGTLLDEPPSGVRKEFWFAWNDTTSCGLGLDDSFWPLTPEETALLLEHMDAAEPLDLTPEEIDKMEAFWKESKKQQRELVRKGWENEGPLFE